MSDTRNQPDPLAALDGLPIHRVDEELAFRMAGAELDASTGEARLSDDECRDRVNRLRSFDQQIDRALHGGPAVPTGLADRLKAKVAQSATRELGTSESKESNDSAFASPHPIKDGDSILDSRLSDNSTVAKAPASNSETTQANPVKSIRLRRRLLAGAGLLTAAALVTGILLSWPRPTPRIIRSVEVAQRAQSWRISIQDQTWNTTEPDQLDLYPVNEDLLVSLVQWMQIETVYDETTFVYDLTPPGGKQVLQFTSRPSQEFDLPSLFPNSPDYKTNQFCIGSCYQDGVLFVVFVEGNEDRYRQVLRELGQVV